MDYLKVEEPENFYYLDIETDGLEPTLIHCVVIKNKGTQQIWEFQGPQIYEELSDFFTKRPEAVYCAHFGISFDGPWLAHFTSFSFDPGKMVDTCVLSYLYNPALNGGHSLEAYGERLRFPKVQHTDWTQFSPEMLHRCNVDVLLLEKVHEELLKRMNYLGFSELSCRIEHFSRALIDKQEKNGFWFNEKEAISFLGKLRSEQTALEGPIQKLFPPRLEVVKTYARKFKKDGTDYSSYTRHCSEYDAIKDNGDGTYDALNYKVFNIASPPQRLQRLLELGYKPTAKTKKGNPQIDEESLLAYAQLSGRPEISAMAEWLVLFGRGNMIENWLSYVQPDSRIHGRVMSCGATTRRMTHRKPNTANAPSPAKAKYGRECRALWATKPGAGRVLVGYDAAGLETVGLCHYLANPTATKVLLQAKPNDIHSMNSRSLSEALGRPVDREWGAKTCVPLDTRILTRRGWRAYNEVISGEEVLGYNSETKLKEWTVLRGVNVCEDEVIEFGNSYRKFRATKNHKWFVKQRTGGRGVYYFRNEIRRTDELTKESCIIVNAPFNIQQDKKTKGSWFKDQKYGIDWEQTILDMSHHEREQFLQGFLLADGHITGGDHWAWSQNKNEIAEGLILASYLVNDGQVHVSGKNGTNEEMVTVTLAKKGHITCQKFEFNNLGIQKVWCPATDLGSWVMRQGNVITINSNSWYAWLYGAYPKKLGSIVKGSPRDGDIIVETFYRNVPGLKGLITKIQKEWQDNHGLLRCIDGGFVRCPSLSAALNYKVQSLGAIVMKLTGILLDEEIRKNKWDAKKVGDIHDEGQLDVKQSEAQEVGEAAVRCITKAGEILGVRERITGDFKIGNTWAETH